MRRRKDLKPKMTQVVLDKMDAVAELCRRYHVQRLDLFGSAVDDTFEPERSDLDFLVLFEPCTSSEHCDRYFSLVESLEELFGRHVDLVESQAMRNPYFIASVNEDRVLLYAA